MTPRPTECTGGCFVCCNETPEEIKAKSDAEYNRIAMWGSYVLVFGYLCLYSYFQFYHLKLEIPEAIIGFMVGPFTGKALKKVHDGFQSSRRKKRERARLIMEQKNEISNAEPDL